MTNNKIVEFVYKNIDIDKFINKVIDTNQMEQNGGDLKQYIYLTLLEYNNEKLNNLYKNKVLPQFVMQIILNQRNYYKSYYNSYLKNNNYELKYDIEDVIEEKDDSDDKINYIQKELRKYVGKRNGLNKEQEYYMLCLEIYRIYSTRDITIKQLSKNLDINYRTVLRLMKFAKDTIRNNYKNNK